jgi:2-amino-4-hydroxy-6-hydroxymethyldihydropteridine diphosphokinase
MQFDKMLNNIVYISLGSNLGDRFQFLHSALKLIHSSEKCLILSISSVYETNPLGPQDQRKYLNAVVKILTNLSKNELFDFLKSIESTLGRKVREKWHSREIDLDILFFNEEIYESKDLVIPHPELHKRDFVLVPLMEIEPEYFHPVLKKKICDICIEKNEQLVLSIYKTKLLITESEIITS